MADSNWGSAVTWGLVILGWVIVNRQNNNRETRKEIRAALFDLYKLLDEIEDEAVKYHTSETPDGILGRRIKRNLSQLSLRIKLASRGLLKCKTAVLVAAFRRSITWENFETSNFKQKAPEDRFFEVILDAKRSLISVLDSAFNNRFH